jgi:diadenosine tetraphosphate (Ap4A) HIT family hydrolase
MAGNVVFEDKYFVVSSPDMPLNCKDDGGHLVLWKRDKVTDRSDLTYQEAIDFMRISMAVGKAMYEVLDIERMNYEDLGNWGVDDPGGAKMHLHLFGRAKVQIHQIRGQHMFLYPKGHPIYKGHLKPFTEDEVVRLSKKVKSIMTEEKYQKMADLAGV